MFPVFKLPLVFLVGIGCRQGKASGSEESKVLETGLCYVRNGVQILSKLFGNSLSAS
jgi:hypothetical protein